MSDYIKRRKAQEKVKEAIRIVAVHPNGKFPSQEAIDIFLKCMSAINDIPSADVRENIKGEWRSKMYECSRENYDQVFCCSVCGVSNDWRRTNFCPNCGADMRGEL